MKTIARILLPGLMLVSTAVSACGDDDAEGPTSKAPVTVDNSAGKGDVSTHSVRLPQDDPAPFSFECEHEEGCDVAVYVDYDEAPEGVEGPMLFVDLQGPDGTSETLEIPPPEEETFWSSPDVRVEGVLGQPRGSYELHVRRADGITDPVVFDLGLLWTKPHVSTEHLAEPCEFDADCAAGYYCAIQPNPSVDGADLTGLCTISCDGFRDAVCQNGYEGPGTAICSSSFEECMVDCSDSGECPAGMRCEGILIGPDLCRPDPY